MRIGLFTDTYYPEINGVAHSTYLLKRALERMGHTVYVMTSRTKNAQSAPKERIYRLPSISPMMVKDRHLALVVAPYWIHKCKQMHLDVIHTQTEFTVGILGLQVAQKYGIPHVHSYHTMYEDCIHYLPLPKTEGLKRMVCALSARFCNYSDAVIVPTEKVRKKLFGYRVIRDVHVVPTGLNLDKFRSYDTKEVERLRQRFNLSSGCTLLSVGRLAEEKRTDKLLEYYKRLETEEEDVQLLIVGDGPEKERLQMQAKDMAIRNLCFTGGVPWDEIQNYYALGDLFVSASKAETQGLTYMEALAAGLPLLVQRDDCLNGVLQEGINGMSFTNEKELLDSFRYMRTRSIKGASKIYTDNDFARAVLNVYEGLWINAHRRRA